MYFVTETQHSHPKLAQVVNSESLSTPREAGLALELVRVHHDLTTAKKNTSKPRLVHHKCPALWKTENQGATHMGVPKNVGIRTIQETNKKTGPERSRPIMFLVT